MIHKTDALGRLKDLSNDPNEGVNQAAVYTRQAVKHVATYVEHHPVVNDSIPRRILSRLRTLSLKKLAKDEPEGGAVVVEQGPLVDEPVQNSWLGRLSLGQISL